MYAGHIWFNESLFRVKFNVRLVHVCVHFKPNTRSHVSDRERERDFRPHNCKCTHFARSIIILRALHFELHKLPWRNVLHACNKHIHIYKYYRNLCSSGCNKPKHPYCIYWSCWILSSVRDGDHNLSSRISVPPRTHTAANKMCSYS